MENVNITNLSNISYYCSSPYRCSFGSDVLAFLNMISHGILVCYHHGILVCYHHAVNAISMHSMQSTCIFAINTQCMSTCIACYLDTGYAFCMNCMQITETACYQHAPQAIYMYCIIGTCTGCFYMHCMLSTFFVWYLLASCARSMHCMIFRFLLQI